MTLLKGLVNNLKEELPEVLTTLEILFDGNQREKMDISAHVVDGERTNTTVSNFVPSTARK